MPVVIRAGSWRIWIYPRDHAPPHVHVRRPGGFVKIALPTPGSPVYVIEAQRMPSRYVTQAVWLVEEHHEALTLAWRAIHGVSQAH